MEDKDMDKAEVMSTVETDDEKLLTDPPEAGARAGAIPTSD